MLALLLPASFAIAGTTKRVSVDNFGMGGNDRSVFPSKVSSDKKIAFASKATNLVPGDTNGFHDVFVYDLTTDSIERINVVGNGDEANNNSGSWGVDISDNGQYVVFNSLASNLVPGDYNGKADVFVRNLLDNSIERVNVADDGAETNGQTYNIDINANGEVIAFDSGATNLVPYDINNYFDVFVRDLGSNTTEIVSLSSDGTQSNGASDWTSISEDGRYVLFSNDGNNLVGGLANYQWQNYIYDRQNKTIEMISVAPDDTPGNGRSEEPSIGGNNQIVAFRSNATNLVANEIDNNGVADIFVRDLSTGVTERISVGFDGSEANGSSDCFSGSVSGDGRFVVFSSWASNLVPSDTNGVADVFVRDLLLDVTERISVANDGAEGNGSSDFLAFISNDGRYVSFESMASNLVPGDTNGTWDVFVHDRYDNDGDGYADQAYGYDDCNDSNKFINPGAVEVCKDGVDNDCDPATDDLVDCADSAEICDDGVDNDGDGAWDCGDDDCKKDPYCDAPPLEICDDGVDNDGDGAWDCGDDDCKKDPYCDAPPLEICDDGVDNDGDGAWDCGDDDCKKDPYCDVPPLEICDDGVDNDGDNLTDCADEDCKNEAFCPK
jgi:hypothetical protein